MKCVIFQSRTGKYEECHLKKYKPIGVHNELFCYVYSPTKKGYSAYSPELMKNITSKEWQEVKK